MKIHPKYIQIIGDAIIPLLGFFMWNWNVYFILLFYFLDLLVKEVLVNIKANKIHQHQANERGVIESFPMKFNLLSFVLLGFSLFIIYEFLIFRDVQFNLLKEIVDFWNYKDMGFAQGYFLIPLVVVMGFMQYKNEFILPKIYERTTLQLLWKKHITALIVLLASSTLVFGMNQFLKISDLVIVIGVILLSSLYQIVAIKRQAN